MLHISEFKVSLSHITFIRHISVTVLLLTLVKLSMCTSVCAQHPVMFIMHKHLHLQQGDDLFVKDTRCRFKTPDCNVLRSVHETL